MRPLRVATEMPKLLKAVFRKDIYFGFMILLICVASAVRARPQTSQPSVALDFTKKDLVAAGQALPGIPGQNFSSIESNPKYELPLEVRILGVSLHSSGDFVFDVLIRNVGTVTFDLPTSRNIPEILKNKNISQRIFFLQISSPNRDGGQVDTLFGAALGGSTGIPGSYLRLAPGESTRVLLPVAEEIVKRAFHGLKTVEATVACNEWTLEEGRYFLRSSSNETISRNKSKFALVEGRVALQP
jgi:hypothetical protein